MKEKEPKEINGLEPEMSLLSVNFATGENSFFNEHYQDEPEEDQQK